MEDKVRCPLNVEMLPFLFILIFEKLFCAQISVIFMVVHACGKKKKTQRKQTKKTPGLM